MARVRTAFKILVPALIVMAAFACWVLIKTVVSRIGSRSSRITDNSYIPLRGKPSALIEARVGDGPWIKAHAVYPLATERVALRVKRSPDAEVRWFRIQHDLSVIYKNANFPWEPNPYKWVGFAKIACQRNEITEFRNRWEVYPFDRPGQFSTADNVGLIERFLGAKDRTKPIHAGSFWFQVEVERDGEFFRSYGPEDSDKRGLNPKVFRVSLRNGEGYLGYVSSFINVPGLFGCVPYQSYNYIGVDCADVLVAAYSRWKGVRIKKDYCVASLVEGLPRTDEFDLHDGATNPSARWGKGLKPGRLIAVRFDGASKYQHIGALVEDFNKNGVLDGPDLVLHAGPRPVAYDRISSGKFDGHVVILEPKFSRLARSDNWLIHLARDMWRDVR